MVYERKNNDMLDFIKIKNFCSVKGTVKRMKRQATDWEKRFAKHISDNKLVSKIYKKHNKFNNKETNNPVRKWAYDLKRQQIKKNIRMANKHLQRCTTSFAIRELSIKTMRCHYTVIRMAKIQNKTKQNKPIAGKNVEQELSFIAGGSAKWHRHFGIQFGSFLQN